MLGIPTAAYAQTPGAIIIFVVDESGSMFLEHDFLNQAGSITSIAIPIESALTAEGINNVEFGLVGFGGANPHLSAHIHQVAGGDFGTAAQFAIAANGLVLNGGFEDGWDGIDEALNAYTFPAGVPVQIILITDEDRDNNNGALSFNSVSADLMSKNALLNVIVNCSFTDGQATILGIIKATGAEFIADGSGGFNTVVGNPSISCTGGGGLSEGDYINLADLNSGAAWNLNQLRAGGLLADSFSAAFVDIKVEEIMRMVDPVGGELLPINTTALLLAGVQSISMWMIPVVISGAGIGVFVIMRNRK